MNSNNLLKTSKVYWTQWSQWQSSVRILLDAADFPELIAKQTTILLKPNLVSADPPPITTPVELIAALVEYLKKYAPAADIIIGEGTATAELETWEVYEALGYQDLAKRANIKLIDLNEEELVKKSNPAYQRWPEIYLPKIALESFLISVPVLKAHTLSEVTLGMKNMMGLAPPKYYQQGNHWKKSAFHYMVHEAVFDLNRYRSPDFTVIDATVGMQEAHLFGPTCSPPPMKLVAGYDPVAVDAFGAKLLGRNWKRIDHIRLANGILGYAEPPIIIEV